MQLISKCNRGTFRKYTWVVHLKDKEDVNVNDFQSILNDSKRKPNKIWVDQGSEFYNKSLKNGEMAKT